MANPENIITGDKRSPKEARENGRKGGIASGKSRRQKRDVLTWLKVLLDADWQDEDGAVMQGAEAVAAALVKKARSGDVAAIKEIFDRIHGSKTSIDLTSSDGSMAIPPEVRLRIVRPGGENEQTYHKA